MKAAIELTALAESVTTHHDRSTTERLLALAGQAAPRKGLERFITEIANPWRQLQEIRRQAPNGSPLVRALAAPHTSLVRPAPSSIGGTMAGVSSPIRFGPPPLLTMSLVPPYVAGFPDPEQSTPCGPPFSGSAASYLIDWGERTGNLSVGAAIGEAFGAAPQSKILWVDANIATAALVQSFSFGALAANARAAITVDFQVGDPASACEPSYLWAGSPQGWAAVYGWVDVVLSAGSPSNTQLSGSQVFLREWQSGDSPTDNSVSTGDSVYLRTFGVSPGVDPRNPGIDLVAGATSVMVVVYATVAALRFAFDTPEENASGIAFLDGTGTAKLPMVLCNQGPISVPQMNLVMFPR